MITAEDKDVCVISRELAELNGLTVGDKLELNVGNLDEMSSMILILVAVSGAVIIFLVFLFWLKGRIHEIGIFLAIGKSKAAIIAQMMLEGILIGCVSFMLATVCAPALCKKVKCISKRSCFSGLPKL